MPDVLTERPCTRLRKACINVAMAYKLKLRKTPEAMIHHSVGIRSTVHPGTLVRGATRVSLAPRCGSRSVSSAGTRKNAGAPARAIAARQPKDCAIGPLKKEASA